MRKIIFSSIVLFVAGVFSTSAQQTTIALQKGQKYAVETTIKANSSAEVMGQTIENNNDVASTTVYEVTATTNAGASLIATITKMKVKAAAMGQEMSYDSDNKDNSGPIAETLEGTINKGRKIEIDTKGSITSQDEMEASVQMAIYGMGGATGASTVTDLYIPSLIGKEIKVGETFENVQADKTEKMESKENGTYTVTAVENGVASISYSGTQQINGTIEQMEMEMAMTSSNTVKAELQIDIKTGLVLMRSAVVDATVSVDAGGMTIPATAKTVTTTKVSQVN